ncbi:MAG: hypothetical protein KGI08_08470 [Thaumarchaeota archaeon]|nr:hypothetical protein [Nitrososphaerota archaeon]
MSNRGPEAIDSANTTNLFRAITHYHASIRRTWSEIELTFDELVKIYVQPNENVKTIDLDGKTIELPPRFIPLYEPKMQPKFEKLVGRLSFELHGVYAVTTEMSKELYPLQSEIMGKPNIVTTRENQNIQYTEKPHQSMLGSLRATIFGEKKDLSKIQNPWEKTTDILDKTLQIPNLVEKFMSTHARQYNKAKKFEGNLRAQDMVKEIEFNYFRGTVKPQLMKLIGARVSLSLAKEKPMITSVLSDVYRTAERHRMQPVFDQGNKNNA